MQTESGLWLAVGFKSLSLLEVVTMHHSGNAVPGGVRNAGRFTLLESVEKSTLGINPLLPVGMCMLALGLSWLLVPRREYLVKLFPSNVTGLQKLRDLFDVS